MGDDMFDLIAGEDYINHAKAILADIEKDEALINMIIPTNKEFDNNYIGINYSHMKKKMIKTIIERKLDDLHVSSNKSIKKNVIDEDVEEDSEKNTDDNIDDNIENNIEDSIEDLNLANEIKRLGIYPDNITDYDLRMLDIKVNNMK